MKLSQSAVGVLVVVLLALAWAAPVRADLAAAKKDLDDAKQKLDDKNWDDALEAVKLAALDLDGVPDADKKPLQDQIDAYTKQITDGKKAQFRDGYIKSVTSMIDDAKRELVGDDPTGVIRSGNSLNDYFDRAEVKQMFTPDEIKTYKDQMAKYVGMAQAKIDGQQIDALGTQLDQLEADVATKMKTIKTSDSPADVQEATRDISQSLEGFAPRLNQLPADNDKVKAMKARLDKMNADFATVAMGQQAKDQVDTFKRYWDSYADEFKGWESETAGPTFDQFSKESSEPMHALLMPKTKALISRADQLLDGLGTNESYKPVATAPEVKAFIDQLTKTRNDAYAKLLANVTNVVGQAEKEQMTKETVQHVSFLQDTIHYLLGDKSPDLPALKDRLQKLIDNYQQTVAAAEKATEELDKKLTDAATQAWPAMEAKYSIATGFDPNNYKDWKGKTIKLKTDNLMGFRFQPGDFPFATTLHGLPIACRYSPVVGAAIDDIEKKLHRGLGDSDSDGRWEIIATVDGIAGQMKARKQATGDIQTTDGDKVGTYTQEYSEPVDAPIVTIIAAHCGPLAVSSDQGAVTEAGTIAPPAAAPLASAPVSTSTSSAGGWLMRFLFLIVGLVAAAAALLKAGYAPIASLPQAGEVQAKLGGDNLAYIGLACAALGVIWLLMGRIIYGFIPNVAVIAAGLYAATDFLAAKGILKPDQAAKIKPLGIPIGLACAAAVILSLFLGMIGLHLAII